MIAREGRENLKGKLSGRPQGQPERSEWVDARCKVKAEAGEEDLS